MKLNKYSRHRTVFVNLLVASCLALAVGIVAQAATPFSNSEALTTVQKLVQAQTSFDQKTLAAITHTQYVEVSPAGEVDERGKVLGFYAIENRKQGPSVEVLEPVFRDVAEGKLVIAKLLYKMQVGEQTRQFAIRASYMLCQEESEWKVCSSQYTGIR